MHARTLTRSHARAISVLNASSERGDLGCIIEHETTSFSSLYNATLESPLWSIVPNKLSLSLVSLQSAVLLSLQDPEKEAPLPLLLLFHCLCVERKGVGVN